MAKKDNFVERRRHPRLPVINNIVEPLDLFYTDNKDGKRHQVAAVLADLSASGMRLVSFLSAPVAGELQIKMELPSIGKFEVIGKTSWVHQKGPVFTLGIEFTKIDDTFRNKIQELANDFVDCNTRILLRLPEVCVPNCKCHLLCSKIQKEEDLF